MDTAASEFKSAQANMSWEEYQKVVDEKDSQTGTIYFRKRNGQLEMAADIREPDRRYVLFANGKFQLYQPKIEQVIQYDAGKNRAEFESLLVLGFGGGGHALLPSFDVKYVGQQKVEGIDTSEIELVPKAPKLRNNVDRILLWIDGRNGVSVQQQFMMPSGDYRLTKYSDIKINQKIPDSAFTLKTSSKTKFVSPQG